MPLSINPIWLVFFFSDTEIQSDLSDAKTGTVSALKYTQHGLCVTSNQSCVIRFGFVYPENELIPHRKPKSFSRFVISTVPKVEVCVSHI